MKVLDKGRLHIAAVCVGMAERMLDDALDYGGKAAKLGKKVAQKSLKEKRSEKKAKKRGSTFSP